MTLNRHNFYCTLEQLGARLGIPGDILNVSRDGAQPYVHIEAADPSFPEIAPGGTVRNEIAPLANEPVEPPTIRDQLLSVIANAVAWSMHSTDGRDIDEIEGVEGFVATEEETLRCRIAAERVLDDLRTVLAPPPLVHDDPVNAAEPTDVAAASAQTNLHFSGTIINEASDQFEERVRFAMSRRRNLTVDAGITIPSVALDQDNVAHLVEGTIHAQAVALKDLAAGGRIDIDVTGVGMALAYELRAVGCDVHGFRRQPFRF